MYDYDWWAATWQEILIPGLFMLLGFFFNAYLTKANAVAAARRAKVILADAEKDAEKIRNEAKVVAREKAMEAKENVEEKIQNQRNELIELEKRIIKREDDFDRKMQHVENKETELNKKLDDYSKSKKSLEKQRNELNELIKERKTTPRKSRYFKRASSRRNGCKNAR